MSLPEEGKSGSGFAAGVAPFRRYHRRYDDWFERHAAAYGSELLAVRALLPWAGTGLEVGVGGGRFAAPLGVGYGIDPAPEMLKYARRRGVAAICAVAEALPFGDGCFDFSLMVATLCFVADPAAALREVRRVLRPGGAFVVGMLDRDSLLGREILARQSGDDFYRDARLFSVAEVEMLLAQAGFGERVWLQTLTRPAAEIREIEPVQAGTGKGGFLAVRCYAIS